MPDREPSAAERPAPAAAAERPGLSQALGERFSLQKSIGGVRGVLESVLPLTVFSVVYGIGHELVPSCVAALVPSAVLAGWRLARREPLTQALSGVIGVGIGAFLAVRTGRAENFFLPSIIKNAAYGAVYAVSVLVRWPLVGVLVGFLLGEMTRWRAVPERMRAYSIATWVWVGLFAVRLAVEIPLYLTGRTTALGLVSVPLGLPLFAITVWLTWLIIRRTTPAVEPAVLRTDGADDRV